MTVGVKLLCAPRLLLLAALLLQATLVQTHVHFARLPTPELSSASATGAPQAKPAPRAANSDYCRLCWEAATAGHYFVPPVLVVAPVRAVLLWAVLPIDAAFTLARRAHGWLSRAPPQ